MNACVPDNNEEYLLYQTLVGAWPIRMESEEERLDFVRRIQQYMEKAVHEAKVNVSWLSPNPEYVAGLHTLYRSDPVADISGKGELVLGFDAEVSAGRAVLRCH